MSAPIRFQTEVCSVIYPVEDPMIDVGTIRLTKSEMDTIFNVNTANAGLNDQARGRILRATVKELIRTRFHRFFKATNLGLNGG